MRYATNTILCTTCLGDIVSLDNRGELRDHFILPNDTVSRKHVVYIVVQSVVLIDFLIDVIHIYICVLSLTRKGASY